MVIPSCDDCSHSEHTREERLSRYSREKEKGDVFASPSSSNTRLSLLIWTRFSRAKQRCPRGSGRRAKHTSLDNGTRTTNRAGTKAGQALITCGHVCIIRGKPITARNACQAVKCYPRPRPGGLMISRGISSARPRRILIPAVVSSPPSPLVFPPRPFTAAARDALSLHSLLPVAAIRLHLSAVRQRYYHSRAACQYRLITVIICGNGFRPRI